MRQKKENLEAAQFIQKKGKDKEVWQESNIQQKFQEDRTDFFDRDRSDILRNFSGSWKYDISGNFRYKKRNPIPMV